MGMWDCENSWENFRARALRGRWKHKHEISRNGNDEARGLDFIMRKWKSVEFLVSVFLVLFIVI